MSQELTLLASLISGPRAVSDIPIPERTSRFWGHRLEQDGVIERKRGIYRLTREGVSYALKRGLEPPPYELPGGPVDDGDLHIEPMHMAHPTYKKESFLIYLLKCLGIGIILGMIELIVFTKIGWFKL